jgi:hypothetical protein
MKNFISVVLILFVFSIQIKAQYSNYYNLNVNQKLNANISQNLNISGNVYENKTIRTIDYGALSMANAQREANRLENLKYSDEQNRLKSLEIASDPVKAFEYGKTFIASALGKDAKRFGFKKFTMSYVIPNNSLFVKAGIGRYENVSSDNITTEIIFSGPMYNSKKIKVDLERGIREDSLTVGLLNKDGNGTEIFVHKKDLNRATVFGVKGFKSTIIWEDNYQYTITDNYVSFNSDEGNGIGYEVKVRTFGNKSEVNFEKLEGRRYYLRQLIEKVVSTALIYDIKY